MNNALSSEADKKQAMDMGKGIYAFTLKNAAGETDSWHIDLKKEGKVGKGVGDKPDGMSLFLLAETRRTIYYLEVTYRRCPTNSMFANSHPPTVRSRFRKPCVWKGQCPKIIHVGQAEDQGQCHEGDQAGSHSEAGADQGQVVEDAVWNAV